MTNSSTPFKKFICRACGYIYDEALGNPEDGLPAGTRFEDIPDDWQCPLCGVRKSDFEPYEETQEIMTTTVFDRNQKNIVIVGAGLAGWAVVDAIRTLNTEVGITLISADNADRYHKPMLSVAFSQGKTRHDLVRITGEQSAQEKSITLLSNTFVTNIDSHTKTLFTTRGQVQYDKLVFAIGASPAYPPTIDKDKAWHINHLDKFDSLQTKLTSHSNIAIVGAGMVGVELAEDLINAGHTVSLIDINTHPLSSILPTIASERLLSTLQNLGIKWLGSSMVERVSISDKGYQMALLDCQTQVATTLCFDKIIVATGLMVDDRLPSRAGVDFDKHTGIWVDPTTLQTSITDIYALGDCISIDGMPCRYVAPHRPQAVTIAHEVLGLPHTGYQHILPMIRLKNKSLSITINGNPKANGDWQILKDESGEMILTLSEQGQPIAKATIKQPL